MTHQHFKDVIGLKILTSAICSPPQKKTLWWGVTVYADGDEKYTLGTVQGECRKKKLILAYCWKFPDELEK